MLKVAVVHGPNGPNSVFRGHFDALGATYFSALEILGASNESGFLKRLFHFTLNKSKLKLAEFDVIATSDSGPLSMLIRRLKKKGQVQVAYYGTHTPYLLHAGYYGKVLSNRIINWLNANDAIIAEGKQAFDLLTPIAQQKNIPVFLAHLALPEKQLADLKGLTPSLETQNILFISHVESDLRSWYKGFDLALQAFVKIQLAYPESRLHVVGDILPRIKSDVLHSIPEEAQKKIIFYGKLSYSELKEVFPKMAVNLHPSRGDNYPRTVLETMAAGIIPVVSKWTGNQDRVVYVDPDFVIENDIDSAFKAVEKIFDADNLVRVAWSAAARQQAAYKTMAQANAEFSTLIGSIQKQLANQS